MFCPNCGKEIGSSKDEKFCSNCGSKLPSIEEKESVDETSDDKSSTVTDSASDTSAQESTTATSSTPDVSDQESSLVTNSAADSSAQESSAPTNTVSVQKTYSESCFAAAWRDVKESEGWFGKMLLLALIQIVPILNFSSAGYITRWGADVAVGKRFTLPSVQIGPYFKSGFFLWVYELILGIVLSFACVILNVVPLLGQLASAALCVLIVGFAVISEIRVVSEDSIAGGFNFKLIWNAYTKKFGTLFCNGTLAYCIFIICVSIVIGILIGIFVLATGGVITYAIYYGTSALSYVGGGTIFILLIISIVFIYVASAILLLGTVLATRAVGHYLRRHVCEWENGVKMPEIPGAQG